MHIKRFLRNLMAFYTRRQKRAYEKTFRMRYINLMKLRGVERLQVAFYILVRSALFYFIVAIAAIILVLGVVWIFD